MSQTLSAQQAYDELAYYTLFDVLAAAPGAERDMMIKQWCQSVWETYAGSHNQIVQFLAGENII